MFPLCIESFSDLETRLFVAHVHQKTLSIFLLGSASIAEYEVRFLSFTRYFTHSSR